MKRLRFKSSVLFGTHTLLDRSLRVLQLASHLPKPTANRQRHNPRVFSLGCKLIKVGQLVHLGLLKDIFKVAFKEISLGLSFAKYFDMLPK